MFKNIFKKISNFFGFGKNEEKHLSRKFEVSDSPDFKTIVGGNSDTDKNNYNGSSADDLIALLKKATKLPQNSHNEFDATKEIMEQVKCFVNSLDILDITNLINSAIDASKPKIVLVILQIVNMDHLSEVDKCERVLMVMLENKSSKFSEWYDKFKNHLQNEAEKIIEENENINLLDAAAKVMENGEKLKNLTLDTNLKENQKEPLDMNNQIKIWINQLSARALENMYKCALDTTKGDKKVNATIKNHMKRYSNFGMEAVCEATFKTMLVKKKQKFNYWFELFDAHIVFIGFDSILKSKGK